MTWLKNVCHFHQYYFMHKTLQFLEPFLREVDLG